MIYYKVSVTNNNSQNLEGQRKTSTNEKTHSKAEIPSWTCCGNISYFPVSPWLF